MVCIVWEGDEPGEVTIECVDMRLGELVNKLFEKIGHITVRMFSRMFTIGDRVTTCTLGIAVNDVMYMLPRSFIEYVILRKVIVHDRQCTA